VRAWLALLVWTSAATAAQAYSPATNYTLHCQGCHLADGTALAGKVPPDLGETLKRSEAARMFYRSARDRGLTEEDWKKLQQQLERAKKGK